jgi:hypothetical protein
MWPLRNGGRLDAVVMNINQTAKMIINGGRDLQSWELSRCWSAA